MSEAATMNRPGPDRALMRRAWLVTALLLVCAALANYMKPVPLDAAKVDLEAMVPKSFGEWKMDTTVVPVLPSADLEANIASVYDAVLSRSYLNAKGERMMLSLGYTAQQGGKAKPHWQEICYRAQGFSVSPVTGSRQQLAGRSVPVTRFVAQQRGRTEPVSYWLTLGDRVITDRLGRFLHLLRLSLDRRTTDGFLVRVSSLDRSPENAYAEQMKFMDALFSALPENDVVRLAGRR